MSKLTRATMCLPCAIALSACTTVTFDENVYSVDDIIAQPELIGQMVTLHGYLRFGVDARNVWNSRSELLRIRNGRFAPGDPAWNHCITLYGVYDLSDKLLSLNETDVIITGVITRIEMLEGDINIGSCSELGISVRGVTEGARMEAPSV